MYKKSQYQQIPTHSTYHHNHSYLSNNPKINNNNFLNINILTQNSHKKYFSKQSSFYEQEINNYQNTSKLNLQYAKQNSSYKKSRNNNTLQDLLQKSQNTINYGYIQNNQSIKKKLIFNQDYSFLSRDHTNDQTNQENYEQFMNKIHFQTSRNRQLNETFMNLKNQMTKNYLAQIIEQFKILSQQNKQLREEYRKQGGGKRKKENTLNQSLVLTNNINVLNTGTGNQTPRNIKTRRSLATGSATGNQNFQLNNTMNFKNQLFKTTAFVQHTKPNMLRQSNKPFYCQSSTNIQCQNNNYIKPSPHRHKRRQSQLTQRKDYPNQNDYLLIFDNQSEASLDQNQERFSQSKKMPTNYQYSSNNMQSMKNNFNNCSYQDRKSQSDRNKNGKFMIKPIKINEQEQYFYQPTNQKNIFLQFLQQLLIEQKVTQKQFYSQIEENIQSLKANQPSYHNIKHIQTLQKQIMQKNMKLKQLQQVINIYKDEIQHIMGTDIKQVNQIMLSLLEVKGKYLQMQQKVNGLNQLKQKVKAKQQMKQQVMNKIQQKIEKQKKKQIIQSKQITQHQDQQFFLIPQSIKTLFDVLDVKMKQNPRPVDYLNEIKLLGKNKQIFNAFYSTKKNQSHAKIRQIIDSIKQGRKKFNQIIKIYQGRVSKLQQKIHKYKTFMQSSQQKNSQKKNN